MPGLGRGKAEDDNARHREDREQSKSSVYIEQDDEHIGKASGSDRQHTTGDMDTSGKLTDNKSKIEVLQVVGHSVEYWQAADRDDESDMRRQAVPRHPRA